MQSYDGKGSPMANDSGLAGAVKELKRQHPVPAKQQQGKAQPEAAQRKAAPAPIRQRPCY